jgi:hypothetical protein
MEWESDKWSKAYDINWGQHDIQNSGCNLWMTTRIFVQCQIPPLIGCDADRFEYPGHALSGVADGPGGSGGRRTLQLKIIDSRCRPRHRSLLRLAPPPARIRTSSPPPHSPFPWEWSHTLSPRIDLRKELLIFFRRLLRHQR